MVEDDRVPEHLADGPTIDDADFVLGGFSNEEVTNIHASITNLYSEIREIGPSEPIRYFVLGNYDEGRKKWLEQARSLLEHYVEDSIAFLLSDLDTENDDWENFYIKFRYVLSLVDYSILVTEDNDGGHELELGEVSLSDTFVVKRDYESASIDHDVEYQKYDAMMGKLFDVMQRRGHLFEWSCTESFSYAIRQVGNVTNGRLETNGRSVEEGPATTGPSDELTEYDERGPPVGWEAEESASEPTEELAFSTTLLQYAYDDEQADIKIILKARGSSSDEEYAIGINVTTTSPRRHRAVPIVSGSDYEKLRRLTQHLVHVFHSEYSRDTAVSEAIERAKERVDEYIE